jgi:hypothetical protein
MLNVRVLPPEDERGSKTHTNTTHSSSQIREFCKATKIFRGYKTANDGNILGGRSGRIQGSKTDCGLVKIERGVHVLHETTRRL